MRSGQLAALLQISPDTLRHYEKIGLLKAPARTTNGYREYSAEAVQRIQLIRRSLSIGFTLRELSDILRLRDGGSAPCKRVFVAAEAKIRHVEEQIAELKAARRQLKRILHDWRNRLARASTDKPARLLENLPKELEEQNHGKRTLLFGGHRHSAGRAGPRTNLR